MADEEIVVVFDDAADTTTIEKTGEAGKAVAKADDPDLVTDLKTQLSSMRSQLSGANIRATTAEQAAQNLQQQTRQQVNAARADTLDSGIDAAKSDAERAEQAYTAAFEAGDGKAMAKAQREMAGAEARRINLEQAKASLDELPSRRQLRTEEPQQRQQQPQVPSDPFEAWAQGRSAPTVAWARQHKDLVTDPIKFNKVLAAHYDAEAEGIEVDSPAYFRHIENHVGVKKAGESGREEPRTERRPSATTMPADSGGNGGGGPRQVKLTAGEKASATDGTLAWNYDDPNGKFKKGDPIGVQEFARRKLAMTEQGLYDKTLTAG